jgi:peptidyl-prolyl cis-trans isomerase B (cyclophilin B)
MPKLFHALALLLLSGSLQAQPKDPNELYAVIDTSKGKMEFLLYRQVAPLTVTNFVNLATRGFYDGLGFHRVEPDFMAQGGDPAGNGSGGPGYKFDDEIALRLNQEGILAMANSGLASNGSQFFITHQATPHLNGAHTVFGLVFSGKDVIPQIKVGDTIKSITIEGNAKAFLQRKSDQLYRWNGILDENFPNLKPSLVE